MVLYHGTATFEKVNTGYSDLLAGCKGLPIAVQASGPQKGRPATDARDTLEAVGMKWRLQDPTEILSDDFSKMMVDLTDLLGFRCLP